VGKSAKERNQDRIARRRAAGRCISCPEAAEAGQLRCRECRLRNIGRTAKAIRKARPTTNSTPHRCSTCGETGHNQRTCMENSLEW